MLELLGIELENHKSISGIQVIDVQYPLCISDIRVDGVVLYRFRRVILVIKLLRRVFGRQQIHYLLRIHNVVNFSANLWSFT